MPYRRLRSTTLILSVLGVLALSATSCGDDDSTQPRTTGACCSSDDTSCSVITNDECTDAGGTFQGDNSICDPNPCLPPVGACCVAGGVCHVSTEEECTVNLCGTWNGGDSSCDPNECPDVPVICTYIGTGLPGFNGDGLPLADTRLYWPYDIEFVSDGTGYVLDWNNHRVRQLRNGTLRTVIGTDFIGDGPDDLSDLEPPGADGTTVHLNHPTQVIELPDGTILLTAWHNHKLRTWDPLTGKVLVVCGGEPGFNGDGGPSREAQLNQPQMTILGEDDSWFILDQRNQRIRKIDAASGLISTVAGTGVAGFGGDGGDPLDAMFNFPAGGNPPPAGSMVFDSEWRLCISDALNNRIRRVDFEANLIETIAGTGEAAYGGDGGPATSAQLNGPRDLIFGPDGRLYVADEHNNRVRVIDMDSGLIETLAGTGAADFSGDGGPAHEAELNRPTGLEFDDDGNLYIADWYNHRIRRVSF